MTDVPTPLDSSLAARLRRGIGELARFFTVGAAAYVIDVGLFNLLVHVNVTGSSSEGPLFNRPLTAKVISVLCATLFAYYANRQWTWRDRHRRGFLREYALFLGLNLLALIITLVPLAISRYVLDLNSALADNIAANIIGVALGTAFRFWTYRRWVFPAVQK